MVLHSKHHGIEDDASCYVLVMGHFLEYPHVTNVWTGGMQHAQITLWTSQFVG